MGAEGNKITVNSDVQTTTAILSSHVDLIKGSSDHDENITININVNIPPSLKPIKIKVADDHEPIVDVDQTRGHEEGPKTPTGKQHKIPTIEACPPAPKKVWRPLKRRRTLFQSENGGNDALHNNNNNNVQRPMRLVELSHEEIESLFPRRSTSTNRDHNIINIHHHHDRPGNIKKVNKANFSSLMSFR